MTVHAASLVNGILSSNGNLTGSQRGDNIPFLLHTAEVMFCNGSRIVLETSVFGWFWIKVYFPIEVVLSHAKYFLAWVQLAISHPSVQFTDLMPVATSPWWEVKHTTAVALHHLMSLQGSRSQRRSSACWLYHTWNEATVVRRLLKRNCLERET